jgi:hypothetical protein
MARGYDRPLYILPFDHRASFQTAMFGWKGALTAAQTAEIIAAKLVIYDGFQAVVAAGVSREHAGILVDEQFGAVILCDAARRGSITACPVEKSGQEDFDFEYGEDFARHVEGFNPTSSKVLVRYNPEGDPDLNRRQAARLKRLSDYLHGSHRLFLFELHVHAEPGQLERFRGAAGQLAAENHHARGGRGRGRPALPGVGRSLRGGPARLKGRGWWNLFSARLGNDPDSLDHNQERSDRHGFAAQESRRRYDGGLSRGFHGPGIGQTRRQGPEPGLRLSML